MSISAVIDFKLTVTELLETNVPYASSQNKDIVHNGLNGARAGSALTLNATSSPAATLFAGFQKALVAGAGTIDLRVLSGTNGASIDGNGKKVRACILSNSSANANAMTITGGTSSGYLLLGTAFSITLQPGQKFEMYFADSAVTIDATHKNIDIAGTGTQALDCMFVLG